MLERFYPNEYINSVEDIDFDMYYKQGIRGVIFDIDNTFLMDIPLQIRVLNFSKN